MKFRARARRSDRTILRTLPQRRLLVRGGCRRSLAESPTHRDLAGPLFVGNFRCVTCANTHHNLFLRSSEREPGADVEALPQYGLTVADRPGVGHSYFRGHFPKSSRSSRPSMRRSTVPKTGTISSTPASQCSQFSKHRRGCPGENGVITTQAESRE